VIRLTRTLIFAGESENETVAQAALRLWWHNGVGHFTQDYRPVIVPFVVPSLTMLMESHWSRAVRQCAKSSILLFQRRDVAAFQECVLDSASAPQLPALQHWITIAKVAQQNDGTINRRKILQAIFAEFKPETGAKPPRAKSTTSTIPRSNTESTRSMLKAIGENSGFLEH
jgi:hypothetical protein